MKVVEGVLLIAILVLCYCSTRSDFSAGIIRNRTLFAFAAGTVVVDAIYYGFMAQDLAIEFLLNLCVVSFVSLILFYTHSLAGGDCKLIIVLAAMYPARFYLVYSNSAITLIFAVFLAILFGYLYLLLNSIWGLVTKRNSISSKYIKEYLSGFALSYVAAMIYISAINVILVGVSMKGLQIADWVACALCMAVAMCVGRFSLLKGKKVILPVLLLVIIGSIWTKRIPFSLNPENYVLAFALMLFQMAIRTNLYEKVKVVELKKGMILSMASSLMMQASITKGLPGISTEDLKSRLTTEEIESIQIWARAVHVEGLCIVKKMPFAIFIALGFITYYVLWSTIV